VLAPNKLGLFRVAPKGDDVEGCAAWLFPKSDMMVNSNRKSKLGDRCRRAVR